MTSLKSDLFEVGQLQSRRLDEGLGRRAAEAFVDIGVQAAGVHADADRHAAVLRLGGDELDLLGLAQVAGVESQTLHAGLEGRERHLDVEVDVGHDRHRRARDDLGESFGGRDLVARAAHDVGALGGQRVDLLQRALDVGRLGRRHRLDRDRSVAADLDGTDGDLAGLATGAEGAGGDVHVLSLPVRAWTEH